MHPGRWAAVGIMLVGLPPAGVLLRGGTLAPYFEFPPQSRFITQAPFSWVAFGLIGVVSIISVVPLARGLAGRRTAGGARPTPRWPFPWWGWVGVLFGGTAWILAWARFAWFAAFQPHTFPMLWGAFILVINALAQRRTGTCLMVAHPMGFMMLFPVSAIFWWFFEYLNRFVQNWYYTGVHYPPLTYFILATVSFAMVLPAVLSVREWLLSFPWVSAVWPGRRLPPMFASVAAARWALVVAGGGLILAGAVPDYGFPFLWLSPLVAVMALQVQDGYCRFIDEACQGVWGAVAAATLAGLLCGGFWEMWNTFSLARWSYTIPFVDRFHLFEMPLLGYAGYLPFGLECALIGDMILSGGLDGKPPRS